MARIDFVLFWTMDSFGYYLEFDFCLKAEIRQTINRASSIPRSSSYRIQNSREKLICVIGKLLIVKEELCCHEFRRL